jgi:uncharacterized protein YuzE
VSLRCMASPILVVVSESLSYLDRREGAHLRPSGRFGQIGGMINLDFDLNGRLVGVEIMDASRLLPPEILPRPTGELI